MKKLIFITCAIAASVPGIARADIGDKAIEYGGPCALGVVASRVGMVIGTLATKRNFSNTGETVAMVAACGGGVAVSQSVGSAKAEGIPDEQTLQQPQLHQEPDLDQE